jgi:hypothetical protein
MDKLTGSTTAKKIYETISALIVWFALIAQFYLGTGTTINFFSFFTILCNILIAVSLTCSLLMPLSRPGLFFSRLSVQSAIVLYIFIVGLVYNTVLRGIVVLTGWRWIVDNLLHVVVPILYIIYWFAFKSKGKLLWRDGIYWIYFPLIYLIYSMIRGAIVHWYPYPFLNADLHGYPKVVLNIIGMISVFFIAGIILIAITRFYKKQTV